MLFELISGRRLLTVDFKIYSNRILIKVKLTEPNRYFDWILGNGSFIRMVISEELSDWLNQMTAGCYNFDVVDKVRLDRDGNLVTDIFFLMAFEKKRDAVLFKLAWTP